MAEIQKLNLDAIVEAPSATAASVMTSTIAANDDRPCNISSSINGTDMYSKVTLDGSDVKTQVEAEALAQGVDRRVPSSSALKSWWKHRFDLDSKCAVWLREFESDVLRADGILFLGAVCSCRPTEDIRRLAEQIRIWFLSIQLRTDVRCMLPLLQWSYNLIVRVVAPLIDLVLKCRYCKYCNTSLCDSIFPLSAAKTTTAATTTATTTTTTAATTTTTTTAATT
eukprot:Lankesteria_metandrocarpae@DN10639_c0_g1_i1.p1